MAEVGTVDPVDPGLQDERPPGEEPSTQSEENNGKTNAQGKPEKEPPPPGVDEEEIRKKQDEDSLDELTEQKKNTSIGAILSGLSTGSYGNKAKDNVVKIESGPRKRYNNDNWGSNKRFGGGGGGGGVGGWGGGYGSEWEGGNKSWNEQQNYGYGDDNYGYGDDNYGQEPMEESEANDDWIADETKLLEEEFGPGVMSILIDDDGGMNYICDICQAQMNGRKSLDVHVNGMKHLKKKNVWDKKRRQEVIKNIPDGNKEEKDQTKPSLDKSKEVNTANQGYPSMYSQPPQAVQEPIPFPAPVNLQPNQWNTAPPPPPQPVEKPKSNLSGGATGTLLQKLPVEKPKSNLSGGAMGTLLQKLAACAVKNFKDSDLATNVIIALVKTMKAYNHTKGDTRSIEVLTEMDVKLRGLKAMMPSPEPDKTSSKMDAKRNPSENKTNTLKPKVSHDYSKSSGNTYNASDMSGYQAKSSGDTPYQSDGSGTWYSQGRGVPTDTKKALSGTTDFTSQAPPKTGYTSDTKNSASYPSEYPYNVTQNPPPVNDGSGYYSQPPYGQPPTAVMDIISSAPPPPPPADNSGYGGYGTQYPGGFGSYYNTGAPPQTGGYM